LKKGAKPESDLGDAAMNDQKNQNKNRNSCEPVKHNGKPAAVRALSLGMALEPGW
jgi:hypothetical protein